MRKYEIADRYIDILQNIEAVVVATWDENPDLADSNADRVYEALTRLYNAEMNNRPAPKIRLNEADQELFNNVKEVCEWRLGRGEIDPENTTENPPPKNVDEIVFCLKHLRSSIKFWTAQKGRQGYLEYVSEFV